MEYTITDIYNGFTFKNNKGKGKTYQVTKIQSTTYIHLKGTDNNYDNSHYEISEIVRLLNAGTYVEEKLLTVEVAEPIIINSYSIF